MSKLIGQRIGNYEITGLLGTGGMASVYRARQLNVRRDVAIKVIESRLAGSPEFTRRFEREAQTIAALNHPFILKLFDFGEHEEMLYLVMELQPGGSLAALIRENGALSGAQATRFLTQIGDALDYAHTQGVIHRDLKPQNVLLDAGGNAILTDFGIARLTGADATVLTGTGMAMGTPGYMAPEQWYGKQIDARTDVYALGVMTFEMLTGHMPFRGDTPASMMYQHLNETPSPVSSFRRDMPAPVEKVLLKALAKDPGKRFQRCSDFAKAFQTAVSGAMPAGLDDDSDDGPGIPTAPHAAGKAPPPPRVALATEMTAPVQGAGGVGTIRAGGAAPTMPSPEADAPASSRGRGPLLLLGAVALIAVAVVALIALNGGNRGGDATAQPFTPSATALAQGQNATETPEQVITPTTAAIVQIASATPSLTTTSTPSATPTDLPSPTVDPFDPAGTATAVFVTLQAELATDTITPSPTTDVLATAFAQSTLTVAALSRTPTPTATATFSATPTATFTFTPSATSTFTATPTATFTFTPTFTATATFTPTRTHTPTQTFTPTPPPLTGQIAYNNVLNNRWEVNVVRLDGSGERRVTDGRGVYYLPSLSGDGRQVAFTSDAIGYREIIVMGLATGEMRRITRTNGEEWGPAFAPDGVTLAYHSDRTGSFELFLFDGAQEIRLTSNTVIDADASFSPDGSQIVFGTYREGGGVFIMNRDGSNARRLTPAGLDASNPAWSPDGRRVAFMVKPKDQPGHIYTIDIASGLVQQITAGTGDDNNPVWSPDGYYIAFESKRDGKFDIYIVRADGGGEIRLTSAQGDNRWPGWSIISAR